MIQAPPASSLKDNLNAVEFQQLVLMVGSRKGLQTYLGMERKPFDELWKLHSLLAPTDYVRSLTRDQILLILIDLGSTVKVAAYLGVSESFLKSVMDPGKRVREVSLNPQIVERYGSVRLVARMMEYTEGQVRKWVKEKKCEHLLRYDFSDHNNAKGRRAETHWALLEGEQVLEDCNVTRGNQFDYDYVHATLGRVNVKSSKAYKYTAKTRKANPYYWKVSSKSLEKCDTVALILYDGKMQHPLHVFNVPVNSKMQQSTSFTVQVFKGGLLVRYRDEG